MAIKLYPPGRRGYRSYFIRGRMGGVEIEESLQTTDPAVAREKLKEVRARYGSVQPATKMTFAEAAERYIEFRNPSRVDRQRLGKVVHVLGSRKLRDLSAADLHEAASQLGRGLSAATRNRNYLRPAVIVLHYAANAGLVSYLRVKTFKEPRPKTRAVDRDAALALIAAAEPGPKRLLVTWLFCQGTRISTTLRVRWEHVDLDAGTVKIHERKTDTHHTFPLHGETLGSLRQNLPVRPEGYVFPWRDRTSVYLWLRPLSEQVCGQRVTPHMARHSLGTWLNEDGAGLRTIMEALGHADVKSSIRYQSASVEVVRAAINRIDLRRKA